MSGFIKKTLYHIDAWQGTDYSSGFAYTRVLNMPVLHNILGFTRLFKKCCIIDAWQHSKYSSGSEHATILNMPRYARFWTKRFITDIW